MQLASFLGLRPLDRVQLNNQAAIRDMQFAPQLGFTRDDLPFLFFQHVTADGKLLLRTPTGYAWAAAPEEVCDVIPGQPLVVRAMTMPGFIASLERRRRGHGTAPDPDWYAQAYILHVSKDRWRRVDRTCVCFLDEVLNEQPGAYRPIHADDLAQVQARARRSDMPVLGDGGAMVSADKGRDTSRRLAAATVSTFLQLALQEDAGARRLAAAALSSPSHAVLNRLLAAARARPPASLCPTPTPDQLALF